MASKSFPDSEKSESLDRDRRELYAFTLQRHFKRTTDSNSQAYSFPGNQPPTFAHSLNELRQLMANFDSSPYEPEDRQSEGLVLVLKPELFDSESEGRHERGIPLEAIEETLVAQRRLVYELPRHLSRTAPSPTGFWPQMKLALAGTPQLLAYGLVFGFFLAAFSRGIPLEVTSRWFGYFLSQDNFLVTWIVAGLFCISGLYFISTIRKLRRGNGSPAGGGGWLQGILQIGRALDIVPDALSMSGRVLSMIAFFSMGIIVILLWYRSAPSLAVEFRLTRIEQQPVLLAPYQVIHVDAEETVTLEAVLPPHRQGAECRWSTASGTSRIDALPGCKAVYSSPDEPGNDQIVVEFYKNDQRLGDAPLNVRVP